MPVAVPAAVSSAVAVRVWLTVLGGVPTAVWRAVVEAVPVAGTAWPAAAADSKVL